MPLIYLLATNVSLRPFRCLDEAARYVQQAYTAAALADPEQQRKQSFPQTKHQDSSK